MDKFLEILTEAIVSAVIIMAGICILAALIIWLSQWFGSLPMLLLLGGFIYWSIKHWND